MAHALSVVSGVQTPGTIDGNIIANLAGRAAGVQISNNDGTPGSGLQITVRGASTVSFDKAPLVIINGNVFNGDISKIDPSIIESINTLKGEQASALYGARGANGIVVIVTSSGAFKSMPTPQDKGAAYDDHFLEAAKQANAIRNNFSDYAFWQPSLITDQDGKASFETTFPDDVTSWDTFYLAMNGKKQSGQTQSTIKSYKPLMAQLALPRFMVQGDSAHAIGKTFNYTPDSAKVTTTFEINGNELLKQSRRCTDALIDTLAITAPADSLNVKYYLEAEDGYFDGEQREVPIFPKGLEATKGNFYVLDKDTTLELSFDATMGKVSLYARADIINAIQDEIIQIRNYKYFCNEQIASKIKALIAEKRIASYKDVKFKNDKGIKKLIQMLHKNQKDNGLWGWWQNAEGSLWISLHVLEALVQAKQLGYSTTFEKEQITDLLIWKLETAGDFHERVRMLKILHLLEQQINYPYYINELEKSENTGLNGLLHLIELKQLRNIGYDLDTLEHYRSTTLFGNTYYTDHNQHTSLLNNDVQNTLLAYRILKADLATNKKVLGKIQNYFLEKRQSGYWGNTYESAQIIEAILPDLLKGKTKINKPTLVLSGDVNRTVNKFPFELQVAPTQKIKVSKSGGFPVYFTSYQKYWNASPTLSNEDFEITTSFGDGQASFLAAGQTIKLITKVKVKEDAEYVMINVPIPAGCSYADKKNYFRNESHREYFKNETAIFCTKLPKGEHTFEINLIARYAGTYTINPAKVELMYFPTFSANNEMKTIKVK